MHEMFSVHTTSGEFKNATIARHFGFVYEEKLGQGKHLIIVTPSFSKSSSVSNQMFFVHTKTKNRRFQILPVWKAFSKSPFSYRISVDGTPNRRNKAAFSNFSGVVWTGLNTTILHCHEFMLLYMWTLKLSAVVLCSPFFPWALRENSISIFFPTGASEGFSSKLVNISKF